MADFDLIQTDAQVQSILNDGQNMQGAGAQTTLTTESVLLKDVNGNYHKILKSSFTEAIRDTLAGLLVNNDKGTTINQIAAIASGDFGSITPANLASVLGRLGVFIHKPWTGNANDLMLGIAAVYIADDSQATAANLPLVGGFGNHIVVAFCMDINNPNHAIGQIDFLNGTLYFRYKQSGQSWGSWNPV